jgi:hypothetical protein
MKNKTGMSLAAVAILLAGCAYRPVVDPKRTDMAKYETDLVECREIAKRGGAAGGAGAGAVCAGGAAGVAGGCCAPAGVCANDGAPASTRASAAATTKRFIALYPFNFNSESPILPWMQRDGSATNLWTFDPSQG